MKKLCITALFLLLTTNLYAVELAIIKPWKRPPSKPLPYYYDMVVNYDGSKYGIKNLDERIFDTEPKAIQEAKYVLKIEERPYVNSSSGLTLEQMDVRMSFDSAYNHYRNAKDLFDLGVLTKEEAQIAQHIIKVKQWYNACIALSVDVWSP